MSFKDWVYTILWSGFLLFMLFLCLRGCIPALRPSPREPEPTTVVERPPMSAADSAAYLKEKALMKRRSAVEDFFWDHNIDYDYDGVFYTLKASAPIGDIEELIEIYDSHEGLLQMVDSLETVISMWEDTWMEAEEALSKNGIDLDEYL